ncbi:MAG: cupin domain-containing protein [Acidobacteriota bacterium]
MSEIFQAESLEWRPVRPEITQGVFGRTLLGENVKTVLTRVAPGGKFRLHRDKYHHLFYFLSGEGTVRVGEKQVPALPGLTVQVTAGEMHAYENTGTADLVLLSLNLPLT